MQNSVIFFVVKCEPFGVKKSMRPFWSLFICNHTAQKIKFSIKGFFSKYDQIRSFLRIRSHLPKKTLMEIFLFAKCHLYYHHLRKYFDNWNIKKKKKKKTLWPLFMDGVQLPQGLSHFEEAVYFLPLSSQKFLVLILSTSGG